MNTIQKTKHRRLMALLNKAGFDDEARHQLVFAWTNGRTESTRDLTMEEMNDIVWKLESDFSFSGSPRQTANAMMELRLKQKRSTVLAIAQRCGIHEGTSFQKFNAWMESRSIHKKKLNEYTLDELDELTRQMHKLEANYKKSAQKPFNKAWHQSSHIPQINEN